VAESGLSAALEKIDELGEEEFKEAKAIIELLKENVSTWKEDEEAKNKPIEHIY